MKRLVCLAAGLLVVGVVSVQAQQQPRSGGRYTIHPVEDGILRVDRRTGAVSHCTRQAGEWACERVSDDQYASRRQGAYGADEPYDDLGDPGFMTRQEVDEAMETLEYMMDRIMGTAERLRERETR